MRVVFLGTPNFAVPTLEAIAGSGHDIRGVYTQPDRPKGRGGQLAMSPVKEAALRHGFPIFQPERIRRPEQVSVLARLEPDVMVVVGYGQIIPQNIIDIPRYGILNVHASLLPQYRGAAPIQWAIANGETQTGITIMRIDAGLDTGDMILKWTTAIGADETAPALSERLAPAGATLLLDALKRAEDGTANYEPQNNADATYAPILKKDDGRVNWSLHAKQIYDRLRGFTPWPGAYSTLRGKTLQILRGAPSADGVGAEPGTVQVKDKHLLVSCGNKSTFEVFEVQMEGKKRLPVDAFLNGYPLRSGEKLGEDR
jgi:methionyl-tRNA formyltransferase